VRALVAAALVALSANAAHAESWCAEPLFVHEWGVHVFGGDGKALAPVDLPPWFHGTAQPSADARLPVRALPVDSGIRFLPVLHFYGAGAAAAIPIGVEVGFAGGSASVWYPGVDVLRPAGAANSPAARAERARLVLDRAARVPFAVQKPLGPDPTSQLVWDRLELSSQPRTPPIASDLSWLRRARELGALWVERPGESERFVFYEAATREPEPLVVKRGPTWSPSRRHLIVENHGRFAVHDIFFVDHVGKATYVFEIPSIPAGRSAGFIVEDHPLDPAKLPLERMRQLLVDPTRSSPGAAIAGECVMGRDPAVPFTRAEGHRLYRAEAELILDIWGKRFFEQAGTSIVYREDTAQLDEVMPLSIYTDMFHHVVMRRMGLALWQDVRLP